MSIYLLTKVYQQEVIEKIVAIDAEAEFLTCDIDYHQELISRGINSIFLYKNFFVDLYTSQDLTDNFIFNNSLIDELDQNINYLMSLRFPLKYVIANKLAAQNISETIRRKYPRVKIKLVKDNSFIDIFNTYFGEQSLDLFLIQMNSNVSVYSTITHEDISELSFLCIRNGFPFSINGEIIFNSQRKNLIVETALDVPYQHLVENSISEFSHINTSFNDSTLGSQETSFLGENNKSKLLLRIIEIRNFKSSDQLIVKLVKEIWLKSINIIARELEYKFKKFVSSQIKTIICSQHIFPEISLILSALGKNNIFPKLILIPHKISALDVDLWIKLQNEIEFLLERRPLPDIYNSKNLEFKYDSMLSQGLKPIKSTETVWNYFENKFGVLIVEPAIREINYPVLPLKDLELIYSKVLQVLLPGPVNKVCRVFFKNRPFWGSFSLSSKFSANSCVEISNHTVIELASKSSVAIFFGSSSTAILECLLNGSIVILITFKSNSGVNRSLKWVGQVCRDPGDYALNIDISDLERVVDRIKFDPSFGADLFRMQYQKIQKDFYGI
jgi:hypothetical protein